MNKFYINNKQSFDFIAIYKIIFLMLILGFCTPNLNANNEMSKSGEESAKKHAKAHLNPVPPAIGNFVWEDTNGDGVQSVGEVGIENVDVELLDGSGNLLQSTTTGPGGDYLFENLATGQYIVKFIVPTGGYVFTKYDNSFDDSVDSDADETTGETVVLTLSAGQNMFDIDAGFYLPATVGNFVWEDIDGDGIQNDGAGVGIFGVEVNLNGTTGAGDAVNLFDNTNSGGFYQFTDIVPGDYTLTFTPGGTWVGTVKDAGADDTVDSDADDITGTTDPFTLISDEDNQDFDAGFYLPATVKDYVWEDMNANGIQDGNGPGIDGVDVELTGNTGIMAGQVFNTSTSGGGFYEFTDLAPGNYTLNFATPTGFIPTVKDAGADDTVDSDADPFNGDTDPFDLISDETNEDMDAGFYQYATIGDYVWEDMNGNGVQDGNGPGINGVQVDLDGTDGAGNPVGPITEFTDGAGNYQFIDVIPGNYTLTFYLPGGYDEFTLLDIGSDDLDSDADPANGQTIALDVESNEDYIDFDAGFYKYVRIADYTWHDLNGDGVQDGGETGLGGVAIKATRSSDAMIFATTSDGTGFYEFATLKPDEYTLSFTMGGGFVLTAQDMTTDDIDSDPDPTTGNVIPITLESAEEDETIDAGFYKYSSIGDYAWKDLNTDGVQDGGGEIGFSGVNLDLDGTTGAGVVVSLSTFTDPDGYYLFDELAPGEYQVTFQTPPSYTESPYQAAGDVTIDSDAPISDIIIIESGTVDMTIDAGYFVEPPEDCDQEPANTCEEAEVLCDIEDIHDFCTVMLPPWNPNIPSPLCPSGGFSHNPSWFAFVAAAETVTLIIHASDCSVGGNQQIGIQYGIYTDCTYSEYVVCQPNCELPGDITVTSDNFIPGEDYFFFIDGCNGTICTYWIEIVEGGGFYEVIDPTDITCSEEDGDCGNICLGAVVDFTLEDTDNAVDYYWTIDGVIDENLTEQTVSITFSEEGTFELCGWGANVCDISDSWCITINVEAEPDEDLGQFEVCQNDLVSPGFDPEGWEGGTLTEAGQYTVEVYNDFGCLYNQLVEIISLPNEEAVVDTLGCYGEIIDYFGFTFDEDISDYPLTLEGASINGCDRFITFSATFLKLDFAEMEGPICLGNAEFQLTAINIIPHPVDVDNISVQWYWDGDQVGNLITAPPYSITVTEEGFYTAEVVITKDEAVCTFEIEDEITLYLDDLLPNTPQEDGWMLEYCNNIGDTIVYEVFDPNYENTYHWTYPADVNYGYFEDNDGLLYIDWTGSEGGEICVYAENECGVSDLLCQDIIINEGPNAYFTLPDSLCQNELAVITYTGGALNDADYDWVFSGGVDTSGNNDQGGGPYVMTWVSPGSKIVNLTVIDNDCISPLEEHSIFLEEPIQEPFVSCESNQSQIIFSWDDIPNAVGYNVDLIQGSTGTELDNSYTVTGLAPLDSVSIVVSALTAGLCPPTETDTITCYALDCPSVTLDIFVEDTSICYSGGGTPFILDHLISPDNMGPISWSGPGIIDTDSGLFHPDSAGFGSHSIRLSYVVDNCTFNDQAIINIYEEPTAEFTISTDSLCNTDELIINYIGNAPSATATWSFDSPDNLTGQDLEQRTANWQTEGWKTISLQVEQNGCLSAVEEKMVYIEEALPEITIGCITSVDSIIFTWPDNSQIEGYLIYIDGTLIDSLDVNRWKIDGLSEGDAFHISLVGINSGICNNSTGSGDCEAEACPEFSVEITPSVDSICLESGISPIQFAADLTGATSGGVTIWSGNGIDISTGLFDPNSAGIGTHTISYRYAEGSCDIINTFDITVLEQPVSDFSVDKSKICITDNVTINIPNYNADFEYIWDYGNADIQQIATDTKEASWTTPGTYTISLIVRNEICSASQQNFTVEVEPELVAPTVSCGSEFTDRIELSWTKVDCAISYEVYTDGILFLETANNQAVIDNLDPGQQVDIRIVVVSECSCPDIEVQVPCAAAECETVELTIDELPFAICDNITNSFMTLHANVVGSSGGDLLWSGSQIGANDGVVQLDQLPPGDYVYSVSYDKVNCHDEFSDVLTIHPDASFDVAYQDPSCNDIIDGKISLSTTSGSEPFVFNINGSTYTNPEIDLLPAGQYNIEVTDDNGCSTSQSVSLVNPELIVPKINGVSVIPENDKATYTLTFDSPPSQASYTWYYENGDTICSDVNCTSVEIAIETDVNLCVNVVYNDGSCSETDCIPVRFEEIVDVYIPNIFSPNNDDHNDKFYILSDESVIMIKTFRVFDRWGELVFEKLNTEPNVEDNGWDGIFNGSRLLPGVYVYDVVVLTRENKELRYSGDITLVR